MATKKFATMSTKKLNALLENASAEDAAAIQAILETRNAAKAKATPAEEASAELSEEEKAAIASAEQTPEAEAEKPKKEVGRKASVKLTDEELEEVGKKAKEEAYGHRCTIVLSGTAIKVDGTVIGVLKDKRAGQVYLAVQTDATDDIESRKVYKKFGSDQITIHEEVVDTVINKVKTPGKKSGSTSRKHSENWDAENVEVRTAASANVGKLVQLNETTTGRIVGLLNDKRSCGIYYKIEFEAEDGKKKITHKIVNYDKTEDGQIVLAELAGMIAEFDEEGQKLNSGYVLKETRTVARLTPEEKFKKAEAQLEKAKQTLENAKETLAARETALATAKAEYEAWQKEQLGVAEPKAEETEEPAEEAATEEPAEEEDLA